MKKNFALYLFSSICILSSSISYAVVTPTSGMVVFKGKVVDSTCTVSSSGAEIVMGTYLKNEISGKNTLVGEKKHFKIKLSSCPILSGSDAIKLEYQFTGIPDDEEPSLIKLDSGSTAEGIGLALYDASGVDRVDLNSNIIHARSVNTTDMEIPLQAAFHSSGKIAKSGSANATANFVINYK
ncbi:fimbrial protein [Yersinia ruckeri]|uniref:fimbrial protein n=1 Tax=Yersinia ruckeri TaxID=29486 RepID=UPI000BDECDEC|nr:fimbrial protein [Yersinia ruckeri]ELM3738455.1 type 1 fimbrial protein [Yersinia ruckeri]MCK8538536.1 type 1 fimbrial protein [Yersinia ruckeri]MCK8542629.1 type 1 fimbrial protein [Yersinia ruckeri]MCK8552094.1 type 1 fimbrial protein [Yersinia ruckeri]MCK8565688.1 type 1 fimbrial protein [Yersinia ruckeri]